MNSSHDTSAANLRQQLAVLEQQRMELEKALDERRKEERKGFVDNIRQSIIDAGYDVHEITKQIASRRKGYVGRRPYNSSDETREYAQYVDPNNPAQRYVRGVLPAWMKEQMRAQGLNPGEKSHRERFKNEYLRRED
ncbi:DNA-binding protein H-NS [Gammaproteobacteria bacterium]